MNPIKCFTVLCIGMLASLATHAEDVEIYLLDKLDGELNHYCIDMRGFQDRADVTQNLQTHTCYSYQGQLAIDQIVDSETVAAGTLELYKFDVCAQLNGTQAGATIGLATCDSSAEQTFQLSEEGHLVPAAAPSMCLTAGPSSWRGGPNGDSPHQIRTLSLQPCSDEAIRYQQWGLRTEITH